MHRFIVPDTPQIGEDLTLPAETSHQIARVLRLHEGDEIRLLDGDGGEWTASLTHVDPRQSVAHAISAVESNPEPTAHITLYAALIKYDRFEFMLQKTTELGVSRIVPFTSAYTNARPPSENRSYRWRRVMAEAVEQSGRTELPELGPTLNFTDAVAEVGTSGILLWEAEDRLSLRDALAQHERPNLNLFIGPEGGYRADEVEAAKSAGLTLAGIGPRVVRAETASIAALTMALAHYGDLDPR
jgi:16S rRNA (uracil1498-N3)-methyltransferase